MLGFTHAFVPLRSVIGHFSPASKDDATELKEGDVAKM